MKRVAAVGLVLLALLGCAVDSSPTQAETSNPQLTWTKIGKTPVGSNDIYVTCYRGTILMWTNTNTDGPVVAVGNGC